MSGSESTTSSPVVDIVKAEVEKPKLEFDPSISEQERDYYLKTYPSLGLITERRVHCTVCRAHLGTAPNKESNIKMHPILRVTHCTYCHDFYNSGEFSKGEDGSELYCRWCGQGGEVYCCSNCPYVFCKACIVKNLDRGVVSDIEKNENWHCFNCHPQILWPLRAQHWALTNYIAEQKRDILSQNPSEEELKNKMNLDRCTCCRLAKSRASNLSSSLESITSATSQTSENRKRTKSQYSISKQTVKRIKPSNDEVVCTPDLLSMLEPDCQLTAAPAVTTQAQVELQPMVNRSTPPPLVLRNSTIQIRTVKKNVPNFGSSTSPVYHMINGFRIDLNSAAQKGYYRLPNGKLIQVKKTGVQAPISTATTQQQQQTLPNNQILNWKRPFELRPVTPVQQQQMPRNGFMPQNQTQHYFISQTPPLNESTQSLYTPPNSGTLPTNNKPNRVILKRHAFPETPLGQTRCQLQDKILESQNICTHINSKLQSFTNSTAYKTARNYNDIKELYIHLSYIFSYAMGRMQKLQDDVLTDMRTLGFSAEAQNLEKGQLPKGTKNVSQCDEVFEEDNNITNPDIKIKQEKFDPIEEQPNKHTLAQHTEYMNEQNEEAKLQYDPMTTDADVDNYDYDDDRELLGDDDCTENDLLYEAPSQTFADSRVRGQGTEESMRREELSHTYDRKLTRLIQQYPSIWCTMHPDYGNFEVTRKHWRTIAVHFQRTENIKLRWKNIRKRYVRIEQRLLEGKRFMGYFDKATNFLSNRNVPPEHWREVDCGLDDGDVYERENLDVIEESLPKNKHEDYMFKPPEEQQSGRPIDILPIDLKLINFVKRNAILWRRVRTDDAHDQSAVRNLWLQLWRTMSGISFEDMVYRWHYLYEMYKAFRLKTIKDKTQLANLELKYSKYLAKLYFLYKIDKDILRNECTMISDDLYELDELSEHMEFSENELNAPMLQNSNGDKEFVTELVRAVKKYPALYDMLHIDYVDPYKRANCWFEIANKLANFKRKAKVEDKDDIQIIEPKTDTICLDSDDENAVKTTKILPIKISRAYIPPNSTAIHIPTLVSKTQAPPEEILPTTDYIQPECDVTTFNESQTLDDNELMLATQSILASMLEVEINEEPEVSVQMKQERKQPRKKTTNKPNPMKCIIQRELLEDLQQNDKKLKYSCNVKLRKAEQQYPFVKKLLKEMEERKIEVLQNFAEQSDIVDESSIETVDNSQSINLNSASNLTNNVENQKSCAQNNETIISENNIENNSNSDKNKNALEHKTNNEQDLSAIITQEISNEVELISSEIQEITDDNSSLDLVNEIVSYDLNASNSQLKSAEIKETTDENLNSSLKLVSEIETDELLSSQEQLKSSEIQEIADISFNSSLDLVTEIVSDELMCSNDKVRSTEMQEISDVNLNSSFDFVNEIVSDASLPLEDVSNPYDLDESINDVSCTSTSKPLEECVNDPLELDEQLFPKKSMNIFPAISTELINDINELINEHTYSAPLPP